MSLSKGNLPARVGMRHVAARAGVSMGTVSNYVNHRERLAPETALRISKAIDELGFVSNISGRALRQGMSNVIGMIAADLSNPHFVRLAQSIERRAEDDDIKVLIVNSDGRREREDTYLKLFEGLKVRGVIACSICPIEDRLLAVAGRGTPTVLIGQQAQSSEQFWVSGDDYLGGRLLAEHLTIRGRRDLIFVGGPLDVPQVAARLRGARDWLRDHNLPLSVQSTDTRTVDAGRVVAERLLRSRSERPFDAILAANDLLAAGLVKGLVTGGISVPREVAVTGYDDSEISRTTEAPLTTVVDDHNHIARAAFNLLGVALSGESQRNRSVLVVPRLVVRQSTA